MLGKGDVSSEGKGKGKGEKVGVGVKGRAAERRESVKMGDVASVVARGRNVGVLVGDKEVR